MTVIINQQDLALLKRNSLLNALKINFQSNQEQYSVVGASEDIDILRDKLIDELDTKGFDKNYNLTSYGVQLQNLVDKLFQG